MEIVRIDERRAAEVAPLITDFRRAVLHPDEPGCTTEEAAAWFAPRPGRLPVTLLATDEGRPVGAARMMLRTESGVPGFVPELFVSPAARRRGIGTALMATLAEEGRGAGAPRLVLRQPDGDPAAEAFADALGTARGFRGLQNRCRLSDVDTPRLQSWVDRAAERAAGWSLLGWDGACPDERLDAFVEVQSAMAGAPVPEVAVTHQSASDIRDAEASAAALGLTHWVLAARLDATGELGGFTEIQFVPWQPWLGHQGDTGVMPAHRQLGLGRWLKAAMALRVLAERPEVTQIETNTAEDNPPMRAINEAMGFRVAVVWQDRELSLA